MAAAANTYRVYVAQNQVKHLTHREYCMEFGFTRQDRADNLWATWQGLRRSVAVRNAQGGCNVSSQTQRRGTYHVVSYDPSNTPIACTCKDFKRNTQFNDDFMCKHMLLYEDHALQI